MTRAELGKLVREVMVTDLDYVEDVTNEVESLELTGKTETEIKELIKKSAVNYNTVKIKHKLFDN